MRLLTVLRSIAALTAVAALGTGAWLLHSWSDSQPVAVAAVRGAQSTSTPQATLDPYPVLTTKGGERILARRYALYHVESGKMVVGKEYDQPVPIASTTKLMTSYIAQQHSKPDDIVTVSSYASQVIGSRMNIYTNEKLSMESLLYGLLLVSGNDAANAIAEHVGGILLNNPAASSETKIERFVEEMNAVAEEFHMEQTEYKDPAGLDDEGRSSALDLSKIASVVYTDPLLAKIMATAQTTVSDVLGRYRHDLRNSNRHVADYFLAGTMGGKTGYTEGAGHCLITSATRNGVTLTAVVLSTLQESKEASALEARKLLEYGFANLEIR